MAADIDAAVAQAVAQYAAWAAQAMPSVAPQPRVMVRDGDTMVARRPFKSRGYWRVRWNGTARIVNPHTFADMTAFTADWSKP